MVGAAGIEPTTSCTPSKRAKPLRHAPIPKKLLAKGSLCFPTSPRFVNPRERVLFFKFHVFNENRLFVS